MFFVLLGFPFLLTLILCHFTFKSAALQNKSVVLGIKLPQENVKDDGVQQVATRYKKRCNTIFFIFFPLHLLGFFSGEYASLLLVYLLLLLVAFVVFYSYNLDAGARSVREIKKERDWQLPKGNVVLIDSEVTRLQNTFPIKFYYLIPPIAIQLFAAVITFDSHNIASLTVIYIVMIVSLLSGILLYIISHKVQNRVYCDRSDINIALNKSIKRDISILSALCLYSSLLFTPLLINSNIGSSFIIMFIMLFVFYNATLFVTLYRMVKRHKVLKEQLFSLSEGDIYSTEEENYRFGFYYNPHVKKVFVPKQVGIGSTVNLATTGGKLFAAILPVVIFASVILILLAEFGSITFTENSGSFEIKDMTFYSATFNDDDIESVELTEEINVNSKINGNATSRLNVGYFNVEGIGNALLFIHKDVKTIIKVTLIGGEVIFLNGDSESMTADYYKMLTDE